MKGSLASLVVLAALSGLFSHQAFALSANLTLVSGSASLSSDGDTLSIVTDGDVLNWSSFSVAAGQTVDFIQPSGSPGVDNRLQGGSILEIFGILHSNQPLTLRADNIYIAPGGVIDAPGLTLFGSQSVNMAGLVQGSGPLNITAPSIFVKGPLVSDGVVVQVGDYQGSGTLSLGSVGGSFSGFTVMVPNIELTPPIQFEGPGSVSVGLLTPVPEPAEWAMLAAGLLIVFGLGRKKVGGAVVLPTWN